MPIPNFSAPPLRISPLPQLSFLQLIGEETRDFLQGLMTQDINLLTAERSIYSLFLSPQGKIRFAVLLHQTDDNTILIECEAEQKEELLKHLRKYCLRRNVTFSEPRQALNIYVIYGETVLATLDLPPNRGAVKREGNRLILNDPRLLELGARLIVPENKAKETLTALLEKGIKQADINAYTAHRQSFSVTREINDLKFDLSTPHEGTLDHLNAISYSKGCYIGQEVIARMHVRGKIKRRLLAFHCTAETPKITEGDTVTTHGDKLGKVRSCNEETGYGFALFDVADIAQALRAAQPLMIGAYEVSVTIPSFFPFPKLTEVDILGADATAV